MVVAEGKEGEEVAVEEVDVKKSFVIIIFKNTLCFEKLLLLRSTGDSRWDHDFIDF